MFPYGNDKTQIFTIEIHVDQLRLIHEAMQNFTPKNPDAPMGSTTRREEAEALAGMIEDTIQHRLETGSPGDEIHGFCF